MSASRSEPVVVLFDGECNLCNGVVQFLIRHDPRGERFRFAAQQSDAGKIILQEHSFPADSLETMAVLANGKLLARSDAALELARHLPAPWPILSIGKIIPRPLRDAMYRLVARNRYRLFGKSDHCMIPTPELKARFLS